MEQEEIKAIIENILLAADQPVSETQFKNLLSGEAEKVSFKSVLEELIDEYSSRKLTDSSGRRGVPVVHAS